MQRRRRAQRSLGAAAGFAVTLAMTATTGCDPLGPGEERFIISVDSISAPAMIGPGEALTVRFFGGIGPDGCSRLEHVEKHLTSSMLEITFRGIRVVEGDCTQMPVELDYTETIPVPIESPFTIYVIQSRGAAVQRIVTVSS